VSRWRRIRIGRNCGFRIRGFAETSTPTAIIRNLLSLAAFLDNGQLLSRSVQLFCRRIHLGLEGLELHAARSILLLSQCPFLIEEIHLPLSLCLKALTVCDPRSMVRSEVLHRILETLLIGLHPKASIIGLLLLCQQLRLQILAVLLQLLIHNGKLLERLVAVLELLLGSHEPLIRRS
jgi:hypothetical protein